MEKLAEKILNNNSVHWDFSPSYIRHHEPLQEIKTITTKTETDDDGDGYEYETESTIIIDAVKSDDVATIKKAIKWLLDKHEDFCGSLSELIYGENLESQRNYYRSMMVDTHLFLMSFLSAKQMRLENVETSRYDETADETLSSAIFRYTNTSDNNSAQYLQDKISELEVK